MCTTKAGWAPLPGGYRQLTREFPINEAVAVDKKAWDWTCPWWVLEAYIEAKMAQCRNPDTLYWHMTNIRFQQVVGPIATVRFPDGSCFMQCFHGLMKSGWLPTLSANSAAQFFQHSVAWQRCKDMCLIDSEQPLPHMWGMGDDKIMRLPRTFLKECGFDEVTKPPGREHWNGTECDCAPKCWAKYEVDFTDRNWRVACEFRRLLRTHEWGSIDTDYNRRYIDFLDFYSKVLGTTGCIVKHAIPAREFAGFSFGTSGQPEPLYANKHKFMLKHVKPENEQDTLKSFILIYALVPQYGWLKDWLCRADFPIGPHFKAWALGVSTLKNFLSPKEVNFNW